MRVEGIWKRGREKERETETEQSSLLGSGRSDTSGAPGASERLRQLVCVVGSTRTAERDAGMGGAGSGVDKQRGW